MKKPLLIIIACAVITTVFSQQKIIADCTITYSVNNLSGSDKSNIENAFKTIYMRGKQIRVDLTSNTFNQTIFYNDNTGEATVLKSIGESKYISNYNNTDWQKKNAVYNGTKVSFTNNTKKILDYNCKEAILQLANGTSYTVFYVADLMPSVTENNFEFKNVPGFILQYEATAGNKKIEYIATQINFNPVPIIKFDIPKTGYKILAD